MAEPNKKRMADIFSGCGIRLTGMQAGLFWKLYLLLEKYNEEFDLTRIKGFDDIVIKHFVDSVIIRDYVDLPASFIDIGTGAGFPGMPLKIVFPEKRIILAEPKHKRVDFMRIAIEELGLSGIEIYPHMVTDKSFFDVEGAITRALEPADDTLSRVAHFLRAGGRVILLKGPEAGDDLKNISEANKRNFLLEADRSYVIRGTSHERRIVSFVKTSGMIKKSYNIFKKEDMQEGKVITSTDNKRFKEFKRLLDSDGIRKSGRALVSGRKIVSDLIASQRIEPVSILLYDGYAESDPHINSAIERLTEDGGLYILKKSLYNELDIFKTGSPIAEFKVPDIPEWDMSALRGCIVAVPFQNPENVGSVIRSGVALGAANFLLLSESANPYHPKSIRASAGAVFSARMFRGPSLRDLHKILAENGIETVSLDRNGVNLMDYDFPENFVLIPGVEGPGFPGQVKGVSVSIPMDGAIDSLNAGVAVSIALYELKRRKFVS